MPIYLHYITCYAKRRFRFLERGKQCLGIHADGKKFLPRILVMCGELETGPLVSASCLASSSWLGYGVFWKGIKALSDGS